MTSTLLRGLLLPLLAAVAVAQRPPARELYQPMEFVTGQDDNLFSLLRSQEDLHEWELALEELDLGDATAAVERLHRLLQREIGGVAPVAPGRFVGLRLAVITTLTNMSPGAKDAYENLVQREAGYLVERAPHTLLPEQLELLATRYPTSRAGQAARIRLGDLALESGRGNVAIGHFRRALDATAIGSREEQSLVERIHAARTLLEPGRARTEARGERLPDSAADVLAVMPQTADRTGWFAVGGGGDGRTPMSAPAGSPLPNTPEAIYAPGFDRAYSGRYAMAPVGDLDGIYVNTGRKLITMDVLRNCKAWESVAPLQDDDSDYRRDDQGEVNHDMVLAAAYGDDVVVAPLQVPERSANVHFHNNFRILTKIPQRRLFGFSRSTGKMLWAHFDHLDGPRARRFRGHDACGPPLVAGDTVYVPIHDRSGAIAFAVAAYDLATGEPKWRRLVCSSQQEVNMFGNARMEFAASPLCISDGVLYGASNLGVAFAVDAQSGETRWVTAYDVVKMPTTSLHRQLDRTVYFANNAPIVTAGVTCMTPLDSPYVLGIDSETGRVLWRIPADAPVSGVANDLHWLCGVIDDEFILTGRGAIAVMARADDNPFGAEPKMRQLVSPPVWQMFSSNAGTGRPAVTGDHIWVARRDSITAFDRNGNPIAQQQQLRAPRYDGGNLLLIEGIVVSLRLGSFEAFLDHRAVLAQVEERHQNTPDDPTAILRLATLRSALLPTAATAAERSGVTDLYRRGLDACRKRGMPKAHPTRAALQRELHLQATAAAKAALATHDRDALDLLAEARDTAPDMASWLEAQRLVLDHCSTDPRRLAAELDRLEQHGAGAVMRTATGTEPVRAYVLYRRAELPATPEQRVAIWQELLEFYPTANFDGRTIAVAASAAIAELIAQHGEACYAKVAARAEQALNEAGDDPEALSAVGQRFPNSAAATKARTRVLDGAVLRGELGIACEVLAQEMNSDAVDPRVLRRVLVAASKRGNLGLCRAMTARLVSHGTAVSDWPADAGQTYGALLPQLNADLAIAPPPNRLGIPRHELARVRPRTPRESFRLVQVLLAPGFAPPADTPLFAAAGADLLAIDVHQDQPPILYALPVQFLDHVVLCGTTLIVPDLDRVFALDYRSGRLLWELPEKDGLLLDGLGVQDGVFHLGAQPSDSDGPAELIGIEPVSGCVLFERTLPGGRMRPTPKPIEGGQLLAMSADEDGTAALMRIDPLSGRTLAAIKLTDSLPHAEGIATRLYPQGLCGDAERVYLPIDSTFSGDAPRLFAIRNDGTVAWAWQGLANSRLLMAALRSDRFVVIEGSEERKGRVSILRATDGKELQTVPLGNDIDVLNWQRSYLPNPAPQTLLLSDLATPGGRERRFYCIGIEPGLPSFVESLNSEHGVIERQPQLGPDFLTFGVRPARPGPFRLYALGLADRKGAFPGGQKYVSLRTDPTYALTSVGPYTVLCCADYLVVLGPEERNR
ncbi:MAG: PQQ-binding-like beta-propeller repeat protein [Planctomycetes bacterium]|nr:PQQ-binding-like beta-propeller repeat protein [Planctomycetota bacterium]